MIIAPLTIEQDGPGIDLTGKGSVPYFSTFSG